MKISSTNFINNLAFGSRRKDVKKADDVLRRAQAVFPMMSSTYVDEKFLAPKKNSDAKIYQLRLRDKIYFMRMGLFQGSLFEHICDDNGVAIPYASNLNVYKKHKIGNCQENSMAGLAALAANGYYNSERAKLYARYELVNNKTGEVVYVDFDSLDHAFAITDMNKGGEKDIVVDPWLGFADTKQGAIARFKQLYDKSDLTKRKKAILSIQAPNLIDYDCYSRMEILPIEDEKEEASRLRELGKYARENYEGILLNEEA